MCFYECMHVYHFLQHSDRAQSMVRFPVLPSSIHEHGMASSIRKLIVYRDIEHVHEDGKAWAHQAIKAKLTQACHTLLIIPWDAKGMSVSRRQWRCGHGAKCWPASRMQ